MEAVHQTDCQNMTAINLSPTEASSSDSTLTQLLSTLEAELNSLNSILTSYQ